MTKLTKIEVYNFKGISNFEKNLNTDETQVLIGGQNGHGKSSLLDAIMFAMANKALKNGKNRSTLDKDTQIIKNNETKAIVKVIFDNGLTIERSEDTAGAHSLILSQTNPDGTKGVVQKNGMSDIKFLESLISPITTDPLAFFKIDNEAKKIKILQLLNLEKQVKILESEINKFAQDKLYYYRLRKDAEGAFNEINVCDSILQKDEININSLIEKKETIQQLRNEIETLQNQKITQQEYYDHSLKNYNNEIDNLEVLLKQKRLEKDNFEKTENEKLQNIINSFENKTNLYKSKNYENEFIDIQNNLQNAEKVNLEIQEQKIKQNQKLQYQEKITTNYNCEMDAINNKKQIVEKLNIALSKEIEKIQKLNIKFNETETNFSFNFYINGIPMQNISQAEAIDFGFSLQEYSNPKIKVVLIKDGSLLDKQKLKNIIDIAKNRGFQVLVEKVCEEPENDMQIFFEKGVDLLT